VDYQMAKELMKEAGFKLTDQRMLVFECLASYKDDHMTTEQIHQKLKDSGEDIGIATVYRTLLLFDGLGIVQKLDIDDSGTRYELVDELAGHHHHHLICKNCGSVEEVKIDLLNEVEDKIGETHEFKIENHDLNFYGLCKECNKKV